MLILAPAHIYTYVSACLKSMCDSKGIWMCVSVYLNAGTDMEQCSRMLERREWFRVTFLFFRTPAAIRNYGYACSDVASEVDRAGNEMYCNSVVHLCIHIPALAAIWTYVSACLNAGGDSATTWAYVYACFSAGDCMDLRLCLFERRRHLPSGLPFRKPLNKTASQTSQESIRPSRPRH